jgi:hypothetical protein
MYVADGVGVSVTGQLGLSRTDDLVRQPVRLVIGALRHRGLDLLALQPFSLGFQDLLLLFTEVAKFKADQSNDRVGEGNEEDDQQDRDEDGHGASIYPLQLKRVKLDVLHHHEMGDQIDQHHDDQESHAGERDQSLHPGRERPRESVHEPHERALDDNDGEERERLLKDEDHSVG